MLERNDLTEMAAAFGVAEEQVRRDHLISHVLSALAELRVPVVFFGGTALARTYLTDPDSGARLSEDIDLSGTRRRDTAALLDEQLPQRLRREFPRMQWDPALSAVKASDPAQLVASGRVRLRIQLLNSEGDHHDYARWPVQETPIRLRYRDLPESVALQTPTLPAFAAMKTAAWADRRAARDLDDLAALARIGALTGEAAGLVKAATGLRVTRELFTSAAVTAGGTSWRTRRACYQRLRSAFVRSGTRTLSPSIGRRHTTRSSSPSEEVDDDGQSWAVDTFATPTGQVRPLGPWLPYPLGFFAFERYCWWLSSASALPNGVDPSWCAVRVDADAELGSHGTNAGASGMSTTDVHCFGAYG
jgi:hypothetical protein